MRLARLIIDLSLMIFFFFLDFIQEFLRQLNELTNSDNTSASCQNAYNKTLAKHHPWLIRKTAVCAMYTMPTREVLFKRVSFILFPNFVIKVMSHETVTNLK